MPLQDEDTPWDQPREHPRFTINQPVGVRIARWVGLHAQCLDASAGGLRLRLSDPVRVGDRLVFRIALAAQRSAAITAEVRHVHQTEDGDFEAGLAFVSDEALVAEVLHALLPSRAA